MSVRAVFMRHGQSAYNVLDLCNDDPAVPVPLTAAGRAQVEAAAAVLPASAFELILVSRLPRAQETAAIVNCRQQVPVRIDARLDDRRSGFEGRPVADYLQARDADPANFCAAGGESYGTLAARVADFLDALRALPQRRVLVVSHHEVLQVVRGRTLGWSDAEIRQWWIAPADSFVVDLAAP